MRVLEEVLAARDLSQKPVKRLQATAALRVTVTTMKPSAANHYRVTFIELIGINGSGHGRTISGNLERVKE
jgi:hypothetical protein